MPAKAELWPAAPRGCFFSITQDEWEPGKAGLGSPKAFFTFSGQAKKFTP